MPGVPNRLPLYALLIADGISGLGNVLARLAIPWFVLETTGSASQAGLTAFFGTVPFIIAAFLGGTFVDWAGPKFTSIVADVASGATLAAIPLLHMMDLLEFWHLLVLVFLGSLLDTPGSTARQALIPEIAQLAGIRLERTNSLYSSVQAASLLLGGPLAGVLIGIFGAANVLWLDAISFGVSALIYALVVPSLHVVVGAESRHLRDLLRGISFIRGEPLVLTFLVISVIGNFVSFPLLSVVLPVYVRQAYGDALYLGLMTAAYGIGTLVGVAFYGAIGYRLPRRGVYSAAYVGLALGAAVLVSLPPLPVFLGALTMQGMLSGPINPVVNTVRQERTPLHMRGRVFGTVQACNVIAAPLGLLAGGFVTEQFGVRTSLLAVAAGYLVIVMFLLTSRVIRGMDRTKQSTARGIPHAE